MQFKGVLHKVYAVRSTQDVICSTVLHNAIQVVTLVTAILLITTTPSPLVIALINTIAENTVIVILGNR